MKLHAEQIEPLPISVVTALQYLVKEYPLHAFPWWLQLLHKLAPEAEEDDNLVVVVDDNLDRLITWIYELRTEFFIFNALL